MLAPPPATPATPAPAQLSSAPVLSPRQHEGAPTVCLPDARLAWRRWRSLCSGARALCACPCWARPATASSCRSWCRATRSAWVRRLHTRRRLRNSRTPNASCRLLFAIAMRGFAADASRSARRSRLWRPCHPACHVAQARRSASPSTRKRASPRASRLSTAPPPSAPSPGRTRSPRTSCAPVTSFRFATRRGA